MIRVFLKLRGFSNSFWADTSGIILPYVTVMLVVLVGISTLALDGARLTQLQTQLQNGADALALAGAAELDRLPTSIERATRAINNLVTNQSGVGNTIGMQNITVSSIQFYSALPNDSQPLSAGTVTTDPIAARFVAVTVAPVTMPTIFPVSLFGVTDTSSPTTGAQAVAGMDQVACGITPMFICNPFEQTGDTYAQATERLYDAVTDPSLQRKLIKFGEVSGGGTWGPGDFGYLAPTSGSYPSDSCFPSGGGGIAQAMAAVKPPICFRQNGVTLQTGNTTNALEGLNTRFGLYPQNFSGSCLATYPPDVNVRKGYKEQGNSWCSATPNGADTGSTIKWPPGLNGNPVSDPNGRGFAVDSCFGLPSGSNTCGGNGLVGNGTWDCAGYWSSAHPSSPPTWCTSAATITRKSVYDYEISQNLLGDTPPRTNLTGASNSTGETGTPQCNNANKQAGRRIVMAAIINCRSSPVAIQSNAQHVPVAAFGKFFLTVPVPNAGQNKPWGEFIGLVEKSDHVNFDQVQLYR